jgi:hypothetical protein
VRRALSGTSFGIELHAALIHESPEEEAARTNARSLRPLGSLLRQPVSTLRIIYSS